MTLTARIFSVLAAAFLVAALAVGTLLPADHSLAAMLDMAQPGLTGRIQAAIVRVSGGLWTWLVQPLLTRPDWLIPAALGIVCGGIVLTLTFGARPNTKSTRRRS